MANKKASNVQIEESAPTDEAKGEATKNDGDQTSASTPDKSADKPDDSQEVQLEGSDAPAILITGAHHSRELITIQQTLYLIMKLLQGGIVNK